MKKKFVLALLILVLIFSLSPAQQVSAYEDTLVIESMQTIEGNITEINTDQKRVTARWMADEVLIRYQDIVLDVPDTCVITKNGETIELDDLEANDPASIRFDSNAQPLPRAASITVTE
jgi:NADH dehydrogenase FAD-containing subunit